MNEIISIISQIFNDCDYDEIIESLNQLYKQSKNYSDFKEIAPSLTQIQFDKLVSFFENEYQQVQVFQDEEQLFVNQLYNEQIRQEQRNSEIEPKSIIALPPKQYFTDHIVYSIDTNTQRQNPELVKLQQLPIQLQIFKTDLNAIQSLSLPYIVQDMNLLVTAPTSSGKTLIGFMSIALKQGISFYLVPTKALAFEIYTKLQLYFSNVQIATGDTDSPDLTCQNSVIVATYEKFDILSSNNSTLLPSVIIMDEIHTINDEQRGAVVEQIIMRSKSKLSSTRIIGLSATISNTNEIKRFLNAELLIFGEEFRPVQINKKIIGIIEPNYVKAQNIYKRILNEQILFYKESIIVFVQSRLQTISIAQEIAKTISTEQKLTYVSENPVLNLCMQKGVAFHNASMPKQDRTIVEKLFLENKINILVSTSTLAIGVNLPAENIIIYKTDVYNPQEQCFCRMKQQDIQQMVGRCGRPQFCDKGTAIIITNQQSANSYATTQNFEVSSNQGIKY
ncbi:U5_small nuclear ribonucleoprotein 200 kDa helicase [Hexamita inflata]|uniref:Putative n=1 Tax=Hexamita inflata TaxID=28002 RepID=A0ABP1KWD5_9EUKA